VLEKEYDAGFARLYIYLLAGERPIAEALLRWTGPSAYEADAPRLSREDAMVALQSMQSTWRIAMKLTRVKARYLEQVPVIVQHGVWLPADTPLLEWFASKIEDEGLPSAAAIREAIGSTRTDSWRRRLLWVVGGHVAAWMLLLALYPHVRFVQAWFFWSPRVRAFLGVGYVGALLPRVGFVRRRLLEPFRHALVDEADLASLAVEQYFLESEVVSQNGSAPVCLLDAVPRVDGLVVLVGNSGLGKTMFLRYLLLHSTRPAVFLKAEQCGNGVVPAIARKLGGLAGDDGLLQSLVYAGGLDVYIDGLNEVAADTRQVVRAFLQANPGANVIITTQFSEWRPPAWAQVYELVPLSMDKVRAFLESRPAAPTDPVAPTSPMFAEGVREMIDHWYGSGRSEWERRWAELVLGNPLDLTAVAKLLRLGQTPNLWSLQEQQYALVAQNYRTMTGGYDFPLGELSEAAYNLKVAGAFEQEGAAFESAYRALEGHHMVTHRRNNEGRTLWRFRHERISDWFVMQTFLGDANPRPAQHLDDDRFRGIYFLLATKMPQDAAARLREQVVEHAAETRDHTVSDDFVRLFKLRTEASGALDAAPQSRALSKTM
jgi:hypothetical protein